MTMFWITLCHTTSEHAAELMKRLDSCKPRVNYLRSPVTSFPGHGSSHVHIIKVPILHYSRAKEALWPEKEG